MKDKKYQEIYFGIPFIGLTSLHYWGFRETRLTLGAAEYRFVSFTWIFT